MKKEFIEPKLLLCFVDDVDILTSSVGEEIPAGGEGDFGARQRRTSIWDE